MVALADAPTNEIEKVARQVLPWEDLEVVRGVPVFMEHTTRSKDGDPIAWTKEDLERLCYSQNARCLKGMFAPISRGHTVADGDQPEVVGFSGNCRLQRFGDKWGVVCDEYRFKTDREWFKRNPRRSPEVWDHKDRTRSFFDPIAALGSETPRLDMPMRFSRRYHGRKVELYSGVPVSVETPERYSATFASGYSTHVPSSREKYSMDNIQEIVKATLAALMETPEWQSLKSSQDVPVGAPTEPPAVVEPPVEDPMMGDAGGPMLDGPELDGPPAVPPAAPPTEEEEPEEYGSGMSMPYSRQAFEKLVAEREANVEKYARLQRDHSTLVNKHREATKELETLRSERKTLERGQADARREKELYSLRNERVFDLEGEENGYLKRCLYSRGSSMSDAEFDRTISQIRELAPEAPEGARRLPMGVGEEPPAERPAVPEKYSRDIREKAKAYVQDQRAQKKSISFEQACKYIAKQESTAA